MKNGVYIALSAAMPTLIFSISAGRVSLLAVPDGAFAGALAAEGRAPVPWAAGPGSHAAPSMTARVRVAVAGPESVCRIRQSPTVWASNRSPVAHDKSL